MDRETPRRRRQADGMKRAHAHAKLVPVRYIRRRHVEGSPEPLPPLYAVATRKSSGEWRTFDEFVCPTVANEVAAILRSFGADARVELIEQPIR